MELRYPLVVFIVVIGVICYFFLFKKRGTKYSVGSKIANTHYVKETEYYKKRIKEFKYVKYVLFGLFAVAGISLTVLASRLASINTLDNDIYNRDIFLCMDISKSVFELNLDLVESLKNTVDKLHGERFGISIFNTSSIILVPLTDDYDYVNSVLDKIKEAIAYVSTESYDDYDRFIDYSSYLNDGTLEGNEARGSSLIGDGLASCAYSFSNPEEDRTRIIIFSTDNDLYGEPYVSITDAAKISKEKGIKVFGIGTKSMESDNRTEFKNAVEITGGKYYEHSNATVKNIVADIESTSRSLLRNQTETKAIDIPAVPFIIFILSIFGIIIVGKKVLK